MHDTELDPRGLTAYRLRANQYPWSAVAEQMGLTAASKAVLAASYARARAKRARLPWPPPNTIGHDVYEHLLNDKSWGYIQTALQRPLKDLKRFVKNYAKTEGLVYPPPCETGRQAYLQSRRGLTWDEIGEHLSRPPKEVQDLAKGHALAKGLVWPPPSVSRMMRRAYQLYERTEMGWPEVAMLLGYSHPAHAVEGARRCAQVMGWRWPLSEGGRRGPTPKEPEEMSGCMPYHDIADGDAIESVQARYSYGYRHNLIEAVRRYAERAGLPWPPVEEQAEVAG